MIHIYYGNGKGKTTASLGLALRAAGSGKKVHFVQLLKGNKTSELEALKLIPNITVQRCKKNYGFTFSMAKLTKENMTQAHNEILRAAEQMVQNGEIDMLIIDEFNAAYTYGFLDQELADRIVLQMPDNVELVLTGRDPQPKFLEAADYASEIKAVKHPYEHGIMARKGIEF